MGPRTATRRLGEALAHVLTSPEGAFQARPRPRSFELLKTKSNVKSSMEQKRFGKKGRWGLGFRRARRLAGNVLRFKFSIDLRPVWRF